MVSILYLFNILLILSVISYMYGRKVIDVFVSFVCFRAFSLLVAVLVLYFLIVFSICSDVYLFRRRVSHNSLSSSFMLFWSQMVKALCIRESRTGSDGWWSDVA